MWNKVTVTILFEDDKNGTDYIGADMYAFGHFALGTWIVTLTAAMANATFADEAQTDERILEPPASFTWHILEVVDTDSPR